MTFGVKGHVHQRSLDISDIFMHSHEEMSQTNFGKVCMGHASVYSLRSNEVLKLHYDFLILFHSDKVRKKDLQP